MKHKASFKITLWWVVALLLLGVSMLFFGPKASRESLMENRMMAGFPKFSLGSVFSGEFMSGFESWLSDNFFGREELVTFSEDAMGVFSRRTTEDLLTMDIGDSMEGEFEMKYYVDGTLVPEKTEIKELSLTRKIEWEVSGTDVHTYSIMTTSRSTGKTGKLYEIEVDFTTDPPARNILDSNVNVFTELLKN